MFLSSLLVSVFMQVGTVQTVVVAPATTCASCSIKAVRVAKLPAAESDVGSFATWPSAGFRDRSGDFITVSWEEVSPPRVFTATGKFRRLLGNTGAGPGEFRRPRVVTEWGPDTLLVLDHELGRASILLRSGKFVRSFPAPLRSSAAVRTANGNVVICALVHDAARIGKLLHMFRHDGTYVQSFGETAIPIQPGRFPDEWRILARATTGFWSVPRLFRYHVDLYSDQGVLAKRLDLSTSWFQDYNELLPPTPTRPPQPEIWLAWTDPGSPNLLWIVGRVADRNWARGFGKPIGRGEGRSREPVYPVESLSGLYDGVVEVIDTQSGARLASQRFDQTFDIDFGGGVIASAGVTADGDHYLHVYKLQLLGVHTLPHN